MQSLNPTDLSDICLTQICWMELATTFLACYDSIGGCAVSCCDI